MSGILSNTHQPLSGKVAIVTGAGRGLGRAHALALAASGASVLVNDIAQGGKSPADDVAAEICSLGGRAAANAADVADWDAAGTLVDAAVATFGDLDLVVNNAGIFSFATIDAVSREAWERTVQVNLIGTAAVAHWAARHWRRIGPRAGRAIVNTTAPAGTNPLPGSSHYSASKAGVAALTISSAIELADLGVRVNGIAPIARTPMSQGVAAFREIFERTDNGFDRMAPENVSPLVVHLCASDCAFTGRIFGIEGDKLFLFNGFSADQEIGNEGKQWTPETLRMALAGLDPQDHGMIIAPTARFPGPTPPNEVLETLAAIARGESPKQSKYMLDTADSGSWEQQQQAH